MILGVGIALGIGMTMLAVSRASIEAFTGDFTRSGADLYVVTNGGNLIPMLPGDTPGTIEHARNILTQIRGIPGVTAAIGVMSWPLEREREGLRRQDEPAELISTMGVDGDPTLVPNMLLLAEGRWVRRTDEIMLGQKLAREKGLRLGGTLRLGGRDFQIVGIGRLRGFGFGADSLAYVDLRALRQRTEIGDLVNIIAVDTTQPALARERIAELESLSVSSPADLVRQAEKVNEAAVVMRWILIGLTLAIAGLFVSNMLSRSVAERRLEFATMRAIGIATRTILAIVASEAVLVCLAATLVGIAFSLAMGALIDGYLAPLYGFESLFSADAQLFATVSLLALGLGLASGLAPAREATRVDPVEVLREA